LKKASHYGGSAWTLDTTRNEYYLHQYSNNTADLNLRSAALREELNAILTFWLDREVDGFNIRNPGFLFEDFDLRDQPSVVSFDVRKGKGISICLLKV